GGLRQCGEPAAGTRRGAAKGDRHSPGNGGWTKATDPATADREFHAGACGRGRRLSAGGGRGTIHLKLPASFAVPGGLRFQRRHARGNLHSWLVRVDGAAVWIGSSSAGFTARPGWGAE